MFFAWIELQCPIILQRDVTECGNTCLSRCRLRSQRFLWTRYKINEIKTQHNQHSDLRQRRWLDEWMVCGQERHASVTTAVKETYTTGSYAQLLCASGSAAANQLTGCRRTWVTSTGDICGRYSYDSTSIRRPFDCLSYVTGSQWRNADPLASRQWPISLFRPGWTQSGSPHAAYK